VWERCYCLGGKGSPIGFSTAGEESFSTYGLELELAAFGWYEPRGTMVIVDMVHKCGRFAHVICAGANLNV